MSYSNTVLLGEIAAEGRSIISGPFGSSISSKFFVKNGVPVIRGNNLTKDATRFKDKGFVYITDEKAKELNAFALKDDIILTAAGTLGQIGIIPEHSRYEKFTISNKQIRVRVDKDKARPLYVYYCLIGPGMISLIESQNTGSTIPLINLGIVKRLPIPLPSLEIQDRILELLCSIDDKIAINLRMNETLEQLGQALFKHDFIDSPEAKTWGKVSLGDKIHPRRGKSLTSKKMVDGDIPVISGGLQPAGRHNESNTKAPVITVSASGANAGFVALWGEDVWSADSSFIDTSTTDHVFFYYIFLKLNQDKIFGMQTGAAQPHIYPSHLELLEVPNAPLAKMKEFNNQITPLFEKIALNKQESKNLTVQRDSLLPRLISGKIKV